MTAKFLQISATSIAAILALAAQSSAASAGTDNASTNAYLPTDGNGGNDADPTNNTNGWVVGDNGGTGFGAWSFLTAGSGGRYVGTTGLGNPSFGLFAGGGAGNSSSADRPFTGALLAGETFSLSLGHSTSIASGGEVGLNLLNGSTPVFTVKFVGGGTNWLLNDGGSDFGISQGYAANTPLNFSFTYNGGSSYSYTFGVSSGLNFTASSTISNITGVRLFSAAQGSGENAGFNNIAVVPEPASSVLLVGALAGLGLMRRRRA